jgi:methionyl-tRNA formyltransferase
MVKLLIEKGSNPNGKNLNGTTILMYAKDSFLKTKDISIIEYLINNGANVNAEDIHGKTIFDYLQDSKVIDYLKKLSYDQIS